MEKQPQLEKLNSLLDEFALAWNHSGDSNAGFDTYRKAKKEIVDFVCRLHDEALEQ